jgi:trans-2,3-dihydro-3-hydroxyanthranilate isomerase
MAEQLAFVLLDVFTDRPLQGNQLAVFPNAGGLGAEHMQALARELNLSETVFVVAGEEAGSDAAVRIFTPRTELPFAGHPVLGAAILLGERLGSEQVRLRTRAGVVPVSLRRAAGRASEGEMRQPLPRVQAFSDAERLLGALGAASSRLPVELYDNGVRHVYVALHSSEELGALAPDMAALAQIGRVGANCFWVPDHATEPGDRGGAAGESSRRVCLRMFAPGLGVAEDPATGSAAGPLAWHLVRHGLIAAGEWIEIEQGAQLGRPSLLRACVRQTGGRLEQVLVAGAAVVVAEGVFRLPSSDFAAAARP